MTEQPRTLVEQQLLIRTERLYRLVELRAPLIIIESALAHVIKTRAEAHRENDRRWGMN